MKLLITGASGFIGRYGVTAALRRGHQVRAVVRRVGQPLPWSPHPYLEVVHLDLQDTPGVQAALEGIDCVIHLAAVLTGSNTTQWQGTVGGTQSLLMALKQSLKQNPIQQLIVISTFSVYDYLALSPGTWVTESTPLEPHPDRRDGYTQAKLAQEGLVRQFAQETEIPLTVLRPGIVYGRDRLWMAALGVNVRDRLWVCIGDRATLPLLYVEHCADAILQAVQYPAQTRLTLNLVDDHLPTQRDYVRALQQAGLMLPPRLTVPWPWVNQITQWVEKLPLETAHLPGLLQSARVQARFKPLTYPNTRAKQALNWQPQFSLQTAIARSVGTLNLLDPDPASEEVS